MKLDTEGLPVIEKDQVYADQNGFMYKITKVTKTDISADVSNQEGEEMMKVTIPLRKTQARVGRKRWNAVTE